MHRLEKIRVITFDVFNTLIAPNPSVGHIYARAVAKHLPKADTKTLAEKFSDRFPVAWKRIRTEEQEPANEAAARCFWEKVVRLTLGEDCPENIFQIVFAEAFAAFSRPENWRVLSGTRAALAAYQFLGYRLAAFTNADSRMRTVLRELELDVFFEQIFVSTEIGAAKPSPAAFRHVCEKMKVAPVDVLHVGDTLEDDVKGALDAGCRAAWLAPKAHFKPAGAVVVKSLPQLADKLRYAETRQFLFEPESLKKRAEITRILDNKDWRGIRPRRLTRNLVANFRALPEEISPPGQMQIPDARKIRTPNVRRHENPAEQIASAMLAFAKTLSVEAAPGDILRKNWEAIIGKHAGACEPQQILPDGTLLIHCAGSAVRSNLIMDARKILAKIAGIAGCEKIKRTVFQL